MQSENRRRILRNVAVIGGIVLVIIVIFLIIRAIFSSGSAAPQTQLSNPLLNTSTDRGVMMTIRGAIVANENARSYEIAVTPTTRSITQYSGYDGTVLQKEVLDNSPASYEQFVYALDKGGMTISRSVDNADTRGVCATGRIFTFSLQRDTTIASSLWTSSCSKEKGTLNTNAGYLQNLFDAQIPDAGKYINGI